MCLVSCEWLCSFVLDISTHGSHGSQIEFLAACMQMPAFENMHMLSVSREAITAVAISPRGDWVALGCAALGQLLVWEWRSERYVLKQQGHYYDVSALAFSPDGSYIATGADDNKVPCSHPSAPQYLPFTRSSTAFLTFTATLKQFASAAQCLLCAMCNAM